LTGFVPNQKQHIHNLKSKKFVISIDCKKCRKNKPGYFFLG